MQLNPTTGFARFIPSAIAAMGLCAASASAALLNNVFVNIASQDFGNGNTLLATSSTKIVPAKAYKYKVLANCAGTGDLANLVSPGTPLEDFINRIAPGSGSILTGSFQNPTGTLPAVIANRKISGSEDIPGFGTVSVSLNLKVEILATGQVVINVKNVSIKSLAGNIAGTIKFGPNSKVIVSTAEVLFKTLVQSVSESAGSVKVVVWRLGNQVGKASVRYATADGTATAGDDYTSKTGTLTFLEGQSEKIISIPIKDNNLKEGFRKFKVILSNPGLGAALGARTTDTINILDDEMP